MKSLNWILHLAGRYFITKRKEKGHTASILSVMGIAVGVMTLITVIAVMNGFQQGYIKNINEIRSYHIRVEGGEGLTEELEKEILSIPGVSAVTEFADIQTIIQGFLSNQVGAAVRAVEPDVLDKDQGFAERLTIINGSFDLIDENSIVLGSDMAHEIGVRTGDTVNLLSLSGKGYDKLSPVNIEFVVRGIFKSGYYEINNSMAFISLKSAALFVPESDLIYGLKLENHYKDREALWHLQELPSLKGKYIESWRDYNRSFFGALMMEKVMMMVLVSLIFVVVAVNIFHSMKRSVVERIEEIALMKAVGATPFAIQSIFILEGAMIGFLGSTFGAVLGYVVSYNINRVFGFAESLMNFFSSLISRFAGGFPGDDFTIYSGGSYYLQEVPIDIMTSDVVYITSIALFSALAAAWYASRWISTVKPVVVLRYE
jgi:lipoprotein-releasing system permease protein